ncbi:hypothetical protein G6M86_04660 [Agrobacterium tumefaciens]|uniref:Uncharacterized protein n=1 Tax=Agrobacterium tumefaciens TaxID=358 RepID=A0AAJ4N069_AGRTU|nr:hypothetical protein G6M86_04660 [Agrobacterium tumefaciens]
MGIFIIRGMTVSVADFSTSLDEHGLPQNHLELHVGYDACVPWARIALNQRDEALTAMTERTHAWESDVDEFLKAETMEKEFQHASQAIVASAICMDAFYDHVARHAPITSSIRNLWRQKKTARYIQIAETLRATFRIKQNEFKALRDFLKILFKLRDAAVHPSNTPKAPVIYPGLSISTDWRLTAFRGDVSDPLICSCIGLIWDLTRGADFRTIELTNFMNGLRSRWDGLLPEGRPVPNYPTATFTLPG